jgi:hypothetical protein
MFPPEISFDSDMPIDTRPSAKVIPFKGKIGAISGDKEEE